MKNRIAKKLAAAALAALMTSARIKNKVNCL